MQIKKHKFNIFPEMQTDDYARLKNDLKTNGFDESMPIVIYQGEIIDGWNRYKACAEIGIGAVYESFKGSESEAIEFVMRTNKRRNLNASQWGCIAAQAEEMLEAIQQAVEEARRQKIADRENVANQHSKKEETCQIIDTSAKKQPERTTQKVAEIFNTNRTYVSDAIKLKASDPVKFEQVLKGEKTLPEVKKEQRAEEKRATVDLIRAKIEAEPLAQLSGPFDLIVADPPWKYDFAETETRAIENNYPTATIEEICKHKPDMAKDCILFLWTTTPKLEESFKIMAAWGFEYKTSAVWDKEKIGMGYWFRGQHELLLVGTKGNASPPEQADRVSSVFREARTQHSKKPDCVYEWIEKAFPIAKKLEMYSRLPRPGWGAWGAET